MAKKVYIEFLNPLDEIPFQAGIKQIIVSPLLDDPRIDLSTSFSDLKDSIPSAFQGVVDLLRNSGRVSGQIDSDLETLLSLPIWQKTEAVTIVTTLLFYTEADAYRDVWLPVMGLASNSVLHFDKVKKTFKTPGVNLGNYNKLVESGDVSSLKQVDTKKIQESSHTISLEIPGVIYLPLAVLWSARPSFSKEEALSGYPIWGSLELEVRSIVPANTDIFKESKYSYKRDLSNIYRTQNF